MNWYKHSASVFSVENSLRYKERLLLSIYTWHNNYEMAYNEVPKEVAAEEHIIDEYEERFSKGERTV